MPITGLSSENSAKRRSRVIATITTARTSGPTVEAMLKCAGGGSPGSDGTSSAPGGAGPERRGGRLNATEPDGPMWRRRSSPSGRSSSPPERTTNATAPSWTTLPSGDLGGLLGGDLDAVDQRPVGRAEVEHRAGAVLVELELAVRARDRLVVEDDRVGGVAADRPAAGADVDGRAARVRAGEDRERQRRPRPRPGPVRRQLQDGALVQAGVQRAGGGVDHAPVDRDRLRARRRPARRAARRAASPRGCAGRRSSSRSASCCAEDDVHGLRFPLDRLQPSRINDA